MTSEKIRDLPPIKVLLEKHRRTIFSTGLIAVRHWRRPNCSVQTAENTIYRKVQTVTAEQSKASFGRAKGIVTKRRRAVQQLKAAE